MSATLVAQSDASSDAVRRFWNANPLLAGESRYPPGEPEYFDELRAIKLAEHSGRLDSIYTDGVEAGADVLDVGCGPGFWVCELASRGARVSACDLSDVAVRLARQHVEYRGLRADIREGNAEALPYPDASFDHVNCQGVVHHTPDPRRCIEEFWRVLRPGGTLSISLYFRSLPLRWHWLFRIVTRLVRPWVALPGRGRSRMLYAPNAETLVCLYDGVGNPIGRAFSRREVRELLGDRFEVRRWQRAGFPRRALPFRMPDAVHRALARMFGLMIVVQCRKRPLSESGRRTTDPHRT